MANINSSVNDILDEMVVSIISDVDMRDPGKIVKRFKSDGRNAVPYVFIWICICAIYTFALLKFVGEDYYLIAFLAGIIFITAKMEPIIQERLNEKYTVLEIYENGISIKGRYSVITTISWKTLMSATMNKRKLLIVKGHDGTYFDPIVCSALKQPKEAVMMINNLKHNYLYKNDNINRPYSLK